MPVDSVGIRVRTSRTAEGVRAARIRRRSSCSTGCRPEEPYV